MTHVMPPCFPLKNGAKLAVFVTTCAQRNGPNATGWSPDRTSRERPRTLDWNGTFLKLPETEVNLIFLDRGCPRQRHELERGYCCFAHHAKRSNRFCSNQGRDMKFVTGLLAAVLLLAGVGASHAAVLITEDRGGRIGAYMDKYQGLRSSGETVVIDGFCASACTIILAAVSP